MKTILVAYYVAAHTESFMFNSMIKFYVKFGHLEVLSLTFMEVLRCRKHVCQRLVVFWTVGTP